MKYILLSTIFIVSFLFSFSQKEKDSSQVTKPGKGNDTPAVKAKQSRVQKAAKKDRNKTDTVFITIKNNKYTKRFTDSTPVRYLDAKYPMVIEINDINPFLYNITMKEYQNDYLNEMKNENIQIYNYNIGSLAINFPETNNKNFDLIEPTDISVKKNLDSKKKIIDSFQNIINEIYFTYIYPRQDSIKHGSGNAKEHQDSINKFDFMVASISVPLN